MGSTPVIAAVILMTQAFPYLPGLTFPVERSSAQFDTTTQIAMSGKKTTFANRVQGVYEYNLTVDALDSGGANAALVNNSWQTLVGFINQCYGGALVFNYFDVDDNAAVAQNFGTGDGVTTAFQLSRAIGGWGDNIFAPLNVSSPVLVPALLGGQVYAPHNLLENSNTFNGAGWGVAAGSYTLANSVSDPFGGTTAWTMTATSAGASINNTTAIVGNFVSSIWLRRRTGVGVIRLYTPDQVTPVTVALTAAWTRFSTASANSAGPLVFSQIQIQTSGDAIDIFGAQVEQSLVTTPSTYIPTLSAPNPGKPRILKAGVMQDPSTYTIGPTGVVTFTSAPSALAALTWFGNYYWPCNFDEDSIAMTKMWLNTWDAKSIKFTTRIF